MNRLGLLKKYNSMSQEVKASTWYTICGILTKCLAILTLPIFTRIMTTEEYGVSTVYTSTAAVVVIFTSLQLPYGSLSTAMIKFKNDRLGYLSTICSITTVLTAIYMIVCFWQRDLFEKVLDLPIFLILLMGIEMLFTTVQTAWMGQQRFELKYKSVVLVTVACSLLSVIVSLIVVTQATDKGTARVVSNALVLSAFGVFFYFLLLIKGRKPFKLEYWKFALSFNVPLIPYYLSQVVFNQSDRLMINSICGRSDAAIYGVAYSLATILAFVVTSIHSSYTPWIFTRIERNELQDNRKVTILLSSGIAFMLLGIVALAPEVVYIMAGPQYAAAVYAVPPVALSVLLLYYADLFDCFLFYYEKKYLLAIAAIVSALVNVVLNYLFIPIFGFVAAAYTTLLSYIMLAIMDFFFMRIVCKKHGIDRNVYNLKGLILVFVTFSIIAFIAMALYELSAVRYTIIAVFFVIMFIFRKKIASLIKQVKKG